MRCTRLAGIPALAMAAAVTLVACTGTSDSTKSGVTQTGDGGQEQPAAAEKNPPGDIPDDQVFVTYRSAQGGYELAAPEGWARTQAGTDVTFVDKLDGERVAVITATAVPTAASARSNEVAALERSGRAVRVSSVKDVTLPGGPAVLIDYTSNSDPDPVTGKQVRLENQAYLFFKDGRLAALTLWAPKGADNVDQWQRIARSFRWV